jgi:hypothetical protein
MKNRRYSNEEWVSKARKAWEDKYDYSQVEYINSKTHVTIVCKKEGHGAWQSIPSNHISKKRGCPECGGSKRKTFAIFKKQADSAHNNHYSYPEKKYLNAFTKIKIKCPTHGIFQQTPDSHLRGTGCPKCAIQQSTLDQTLSENEVNFRLSKKCGKGDFMVRLVKGAYKGMNSKSAVICTIHGRQPRRIMTSVMTSPCLECSNTKHVRGYTTNEFLKILKKRFNNKYKIHEFVYQGKKTIIKMNCEREGHGSFTLKAAGIHRSAGCHRCAYEKGTPNRLKGQKKALEKSREKREKDWLEKSRERHGEFYDYSEVIYKDQHTPVLIGCPIHGFRSQEPTTHLTSGCRLCADTNLKGLYTKKYFQKHPSEKTKQGLLYYLKFHSKNEIFYKVGITVNTVSNRFAMVPKDKIQYDILEILETNIFEAWRREERIQKTHGDKYRYRPVLNGMSPRDYRIGPSECFSKPLPKKLRVENFR